MDSQYPLYHELFKCFDASLFFHAENRLHRPYLLDTADFSKFSWADFCHMV
jgi:hypothetical protein